MAAWFPLLPWSPGSFCQAPLGKLAQSPIWAWQAKVPLRDPLRFLSLSSLRQTGLCLSLALLLSPFLSLTLSLSLPFPLSFSQQTPHSDSVYVAYSVTRSSPHPPWEPPRFPLGCDIKHPPCRGITSVCCQSVLSKLTCKFCYPIVVSPVGFKKSFYFFIWCKMAHISQPRVWRSGDSLLPSVLSFGHTGLGLDSCPQAWPWVLYTPNHRSFHFFISTNPCMCGEIFSQSVFLSNLDLKPYL